MNKKEAIEKIRLYLFDMDGTLYLGDRLYDFTIELLETIKAKGGKYLFMTNNSSKSVEDYIKKLAKLGIEATREDFITSSQATAYYLKEHHKDQKLYVCGTNSLKKELQMEGFTITEELDEVDCIVMGFDTELTFKKLEDVSKLLLTRPELPYIATNPDLVCPTEYGSVPDCGSVCGMIFNATGKKPIVIGKPTPLMPQLAMAHTGFSKEETAVFGDRIYTDVKSGLNAGILSVLVMSGETTYEILEASEEKPHLVMESAKEILDILKENKDTFAEEKTMTTLETQRLQLRPWQESDLDMLYELAKDPQVGPDCGWNPHQNKEESQHVLTKLLMNTYTWAIVLKETGEVIGDISLMPFGTSNHAKNENEKEIGFWLGRPYWGKGYMPEACLRLLKYGFEEKNADCIWCAHHAENHKSARVQQKCGFRFHHKKEHVYLRQLDIYRDAVVNCITREDWNKR